jgi:hypothetical protein
LENPQETSSIRLWSFGKALAAFCRLLPSAYRTQLLALSNMLLQPVSEEAGESKEQPYDRKLLKDVCAHLRTQDLAVLLKYPFCTGEAEQIVLNQVKRNPDRNGDVRNFGGNVWKFAEQADALDVKNIDSPATRPSVQDAIEELNELQVRFKNADGR